jgi:hypothetical protein
MDRGAVQGRDRPLAAGNMVARAQGARRQTVSNPETVVQQAIRLALGGERDLVLWRNSTGMAEHLDQHGRTYRQRYGLAVGSADLVGILAPHGRMVALEVKTARGRTTPEQDQWLALVRSRGGFAAVVRSVEEARAALERARAGESE